MDEYYVDRFKDAYNAKLNSVRQKQRETTPSSKAVFESRDHKQSQSQQN